MYPTSDPLFDCEHVLRPIYVWITNILYVEAIGEIKKKVPVSPVCLSVYLVSDEYGDKI